LLCGFVRLRRAAFAGNPPLGVALKATSFGGGGLLHRESRQSFLSKFFFKLVGKKLNQSKLLFEDAIPLKPFLSCHFS
jgi:hypothetical protein